MTKKWLMRFLFAVLGALPLLLIGWQMSQPGGLGPDPGQTLTRQLGLYGLQFLCLTLLVTPLMQVCGWRGLLPYRRWLGLCTFAYALLHLASYVLLILGGVWAELPDELARRPYILVGAMALLILLLLGLTSNRWSQRRLGKNWKRLHRLVYLAALLVLAHYIWQVRADFFDQLIYSVILIILLGYRLLKWRPVQGLITKRS